MPFYEYTCSKCGHHHEELQKVSDPPLRKCPECGKNALTRLMSAPVFRLKGGGWYETDFKSDQESKRNLAGEKDAAPAAEPVKAAEPAAADKPEAAAKPETPAAKSTGKTSVAVRKPVPGKAKPPPKKPTPRKPPARKAAGGKRR